jgi:hypothetical protein
MAKKSLSLDHDSIKKMLHYNPETGVFTWLARPSNWAGWNLRYAGKPAGTLAPSGYSQIRVGRMLVRCHRLAWFWMTGTWPASQVDHINMIRGDNRWANLRLATVSQNRCNRTRTRLNKSGYKGVFYFKPTGRWRAEIRFQNVSYSLGYFATPQGAYDAYCKRAKELHGEFARLL